MSLKQLICACTATVLIAVPAAADRLTIFAAASLNAPLTVVLDGTDAAVSYAGSSTLARQIVFGAPADVFLSANVDWVDYLVGQGIRIAARKQFAGNVLIVAGRKDGDGSDVETWLLDTGPRIAVPLVDAVPLGQYTKQALTKLGWFERLEPRLAQTDNAATARALLLEGAVETAFLYRSDIHGTDLREISRLRGTLHDPIRYVAVALTDRGREIVDVLTSDMAQKIFMAHGFTRVD